MEPPMEKMMPKKKFYLKEETAAVENKMVSAAEKIIKMRVSDEAINRELKDMIKELNIERKEQHATIYTQLKRINELEGELQKEFRRHEDIAAKTKNTREICITIETYMKSLVTTLNVCQNDRHKLSECYTLAVAAINKNNEFGINLEKEYAKKEQELQRELKMERENKSEAIKTWNDTKDTLEGIIKRLEKQCSMLTDEVKQFQREKDEVEKNMNSTKIEMAKLLSESKQSMQIISKLEAHVNHVNNENIKFKAENKKIISESDKRISKLETDLDASKKVLFDSDVYTKSIIVEKNKLDEELELLKKDLKNDQIKYEKLEKEFSDIKLQNEKLEKNEMEFNEEIIRLKNSVSEINAVILKYTEENESLTLKCNQSSDMLRDKEIQWEKEKSDLLSDITKDKMENDEILKLNEENVAKINSLEEKLREFENTETEYQTKLNVSNEEFRNKINSLMAQIMTYKDEINNIKNCNDALAKEKEVLKDELNDLKYNADKNNEEVNEMKAEVEELKIKLDTKTKECEDMIDKLAISEMTPKTNTNVKPSIDNIFDSLKLNEKLEITPSQNYTKKTSVSGPLKRKTPVTKSNYYDGMSDSSVEGYALEPTVINNYMKSLKAGDQGKTQLKFFSTKKAKIDENLESSMTFPKPKNVKIKTPRIFTSRKQPENK